MIKTSTATLSEYSGQGVLQSTKSGGMAFAVLIAINPEVFMNSSRIRISIFSALILFSNLVSAEVGEFTLSEGILKQLQLSSSKTEPFMKEGRLVDPDIHVLVTPSLEESTSEGKLNLDINLSGTSRTRSNNPVGRRHSVNVVVDSNVQARFQQGLNLGSQGLSLGEFTGDVQIQTNNIQSSNNFRLINGLVNRKALEQAPGQIASELPKEKSKLKNEVMTEVEDGTNTARNFFQQSMESLNMMFPESRDLPFGTKFSTESGSDHKLLKVEAVDRDGSKQRPPKPIFENKDQMLATGVFHQDLLTDIISSEIAGKELKISQLKKILCSPQFQKIINFCSTESNSETDSLSLVFDKSEPIKFVFENGKVSLKLKAAYRTGVPKIDSDNLQLLNSPGETKPAFETVPYNIEIGYDVENGVAKLNKMSVQEVNTPSSLFDYAVDRIFGSKDHADAKQEKGRPTAEGFLNPLVKKKIVTELDKMLAKEIEFHSVSIPTKVNVQGSKGAKTIVVNQAGSLLPVEVKSENGWLAVGSTFCTSEQKAFGVTFDSPGVIKSVDDMSPAAMTGFKKGDRIETFADSQGRSHAFGNSYDSFISFIQEKAANKSSLDRKIEVSGKDSSGRPYKRTIFLCPSQMNHLEKVRQTLAQLKKTE